MFYIDIWNEQIALQWRGGLPEGLSEEALAPYYKSEYVERNFVNGIKETGEPGLVLKIEPKKSPVPLRDKLKDCNDLLRFFPPLQGFARYNEKHRCFFLAFSKQNLIRVHQALGPIRVNSGQWKIDKLKEKDAALQETVRKAQAVKRRDNLPQYSYKVPPKGPYQHKGTVYLTNVEAAALFADCGCIAGDAVVTVKGEGERGFPPRRMTLAQLHDLAAEDDCPCIFVLANRSGSIGFQRIQKVVQRGVKPVLLLSLKDGKKLKLTADHEVLTEKGWRRANNISAVIDFVRVHSAHRFVRVKSVKPAGEEMTYDIVCADPHRNFVANGIVVHNCGKTYMAICSTEQQIQKGLLERGKTLIAVKLQTIEHGWVKDAREFTNLKVSTLWAKPGPKRKEKILAALAEDADVYVINHDGVRFFEEELCAKRFQKVVIDESTILKGYTSPRAKGGAFGKAILNVAKDAKYRVIMSGTPAPNSAEDLWPQAKFLDPSGLLLEASIHDFRSRYMKEVHFGDPNDPNTKSTWVLKKSSVPEIASIIDAISYRVLLRDVQKDLPERTNIVRKVAMGASQLKHYEEMEETLMTVIDDTSISVKMQLSMIQKLRQITGGFLIDPQEVAHPIEDASKLTVMDSLLEDEIAREHKVVIFAQYQWEIEMLAARYKDHGVVTVYGGNSGAKNLDNITKFLQDPGIREIILHPRSAMHGLTFVNAHYLVFYSGSYSSEEDYQCARRIERTGQKNAMFVYYLQAEDSIDEIMYEVVQAKHENQAQLIDGDGADAAAIAVWKKLSQALREKRARRKKKRGKAAKEERICG